MTLIHFFQNDLKHTMKLSKLRKGQKTLHQKNYKANNRIQEMIKDYEHVYIWRLHRAGPAPSPATLRHSREWPCTSHGQHSRADLGDMSSGKLAPPLARFATQVSWPCPSPRQCWRAGSGGMGVEELAPKAWTQESQSVLPLASCCRQESWSWCRGHRRTDGLTNSTTSRV